MGGLAHSILNPINDISNILEGTKNLFVNPLKQITKYVEPATLEALPAAVAVAGTVLSGGLLAPAALPFLIGGATVYGAQAVTEGSSKMFSGTPPSIGDFAAGAAAGGLTYGAEAALPALMGSGGAAGTAGVAAPGLAGAGTAAAGTAAAGTAAAGTAAAGAAAAGGGIFTAGNILGAASLGLAGYGLYANQTAQAAAKSAAANAQQSQATAQQQSLCQQLEGMTAAQLATENWSAIVPNLSPSCKTALATNFSPKLVASMSAAAKSGQISQTDYSSFQSILPASTVNAASTLYNTCSNYLSSPTQFAACLNSSYNAATGAVSTTPVSAANAAINGLTSPSTFYEGNGGMVGNAATTAAAVNSNPFPWNTVLLVGGGAVGVYVIYELIFGGK